MTPIGTAFPALPKRASFQEDPLGGFNEYCTLEQAKETKALFNAVVASVQSEMGLYPFSGSLSIPTFDGVPDGLLPAQIAGQSKLGPDGKTYYNFQLTIEFFMNGVLQTNVKTQLSNAAMMMNEFYRYPTNYALAINNMSIPGVTLPV